MEETASLSKAGDYCVGDIDKSQKGEEEKRHNFLKKWKKIQGSDATYRNLHDALLKINCREDAERVFKIMQEPSVESTPTPSTDQTKQEAPSTRAPSVSTTPPTEPADLILPKVSPTIEPGKREVFLLS